MGGGALAEVKVGVWWFGLARPGSRPGHIQGSSRAYPGLHPGLIEGLQRKGIPDLGEMLERVYY